MCLSYQGELLGPGKFGKLQNLFTGDALSLPLGGNLESPKERVMGVSLCVDDFVGRALDLTTGTVVV